MSIFLVGCCSANLRRLHWQRSPLLIPSACLPVCPAALVCVRLLVRLFPLSSLSICLTICRPFWPAFLQFFSLSVCFTVHLPLCLRLPASLSLLVHLCPLSSLCIYLSVHLHFYPSALMSFWPSAFLPFFFFVSVFHCRLRFCLRLSVCLFPVIRHHPSSHEIHL